MDLKNLKDKDLINLYPLFLKELRSRGIIKTKNFVGELGEYITKRVYSETRNLTKLSDAPPSTKNVDALGANGERYAIKASSSVSTGVFASLPIEEDGKQYFEYLVVVLFDEDYSIKNILEADWKTFYKFRKIKNPEKKWFISVTQKFISACRQIPFDSLNL